MIFVYRPQKSASAKALAMAIDGVRIKHDYNLTRRARQTDKVVMWGAFLDGLNTTRVLNNVPLQSKYEDAVRLSEAGVRTVEVSRLRPMAEPVPAPVDPLIAIWEDAQEAAEAFANLEPTRLYMAMQGVVELRNKLSNVMTAMQVQAPVAPPPQPAADWLARHNDHVGGNDLLNPDGRADYYSKRERFIYEYRVHSFLGHSIRLGRKIPRTPQSETPFNGTPHEWVRSFDAGWQLSYADDAIISSKKQGIRDIAHAAVAALGLNFGAVDVGELPDGTLVVLEVNRAAGIEAGTIDAYAKAVRRWVDGEWQ